MKHRLKRYLVVSSCTKAAIAPLCNTLHEKSKTCGPASYVVYLEQNLLYSLILTKVCES